MSTPESGSTEGQPVHETAEYSQPSSFTEGPDQGVTHLVAENGGNRQSETYLPLTDQAENGGNMQGETYLPPMLRDHTRCT